VRAISEDSRYRFVTIYRHGRASLCLLRAPAPCSAKTRLRQSLPDRNLLWLYLTRKVGLWNMEHTM
jgi:hypothetical protein